MDNNTLIRLYHKGWNDCSNGTDNSNFYSGIKLRAYNTGWQNYVIGDEVKSVDSWTEQKILEVIKNGKEKISSN